MKRPSNDDLSIEISFLQGLRSRMPHDPELLKLLGDDYTRAGRWKEGLEIDLELGHLLPRDSMVQYNLACSLSLLGRLKESAKALARAIQFGYSDLDYLRRDPDLENLRKSMEFSPVEALLKATVKR